MGGVGMKKGKLLFVLLYITIFFFHAPGANSANATTEHPAALAQIPAEAECSVLNDKTALVNNPTNEDKDIIIQRPSIRENQQLDHPMLIPGRLDIDPKMIIPGNPLIDPRMLIDTNGNKLLIQYEIRIPEKE